MAFYIKEFTSFGSDIILKNESPTGTSASRLEVVSAGSGGLAYALVMPFTPPYSANISLTALAAGFAVDGEIEKILASGTTVAKVRAHWRLKESAT